MVSTEVYRIEYCSGQVLVEVMLDSEEGKMELSKYVWRALFSWKT